MKINFVCAPCKTSKEDLALDAEQIAYIMDCVKRTNNNELLKVTLPLKTGPCQNEISG